MPDKMSPHNHMQRALNFTQINSKRDNQAELEQDSKRFRNNFEQMSYLLTKELEQNITIEATQARIVEANAQFEKVMDGAKPQMKMYELLDKNRTTYLLYRTMQRWMNNHAFSTRTQKESMSNMEFAKEFFSIIDSDDSGKTDFEELALPLIALGLSSDTSFVSKVFRAIYP